MPRSRTLLNNKRKNKKRKRKIARQPAHLIRKIQYAEKEKEEQFITRRRKENNLVKILSRPLKKSLDIEFEMEIVVEN